MADKFVCVNVGAQRERLRTVENKVVSTKPGEISGQFVWRDMPPATNNIAASGNSGEEASDDRCRYPMPREFEHNPRRITPGKAPSLTADEIPPWISTNNKKEHTRRLMAMGPYDCYICAIWGLDNHPPIESQDGKDQNTRVLSEYEMECILHGQSVGSEMTGTMLDQVSDYTLRKYGKRTEWHVNVRMKAYHADTSAVSSRENNRKSRKKANRGTTRKRKPRR